MSSLIWLIALDQSMNLHGIDLIVFVHDSPLRIGEVTDSVPGVCNYG